MKKINFLILALCSTLMIEGNSFATKNQKHRTAKKDVKKEAKKAIKEVNNHKKSNNKVGRLNHGRRNNEVGRHNRPRYRVAPNNNSSATTPSAANSSGLTDEASDFMSGGNNEGINKITEAIKELKSTSKSTSK